MIALSVSVLTSYKILGHHVIRNVRKFQNCVSDHKFLFAKPIVKTF